MKKYQSAFPGGNENRPGMTLRDYFAAAALTGFLANDEIQKHFRKGGRDANHMNASASYQAADAMLKARKVEYE